MDTNGFRTLSSVLKVDTEVGKIRPEFRQTADHKYLIYHTFLKIRIKINFLMIVEVKTFK